MSIQLFEESKPLAEKIDNLLDENNYEKLVVCVHKLEDYVSNNEFKKEDSIFYYIGTIYSSLANFKKESENGSSEETKIEYRKQANYYFRKALELIDPDDMLLLVVYINYANNLDACGRVLEALRFYRKAIEINPVFGMAIGNYGKALNFLANMVNDGGHYRELHCYAYQALCKALQIQDINMSEYAVEYFKSMCEKYSDQTKIPENLLKTNIEHQEYQWDDLEERAYRKWCLNNHLFLNPLNEVIDSSTAFAHDPLTIIQFTEWVKETDSIEDNKPPKYFAMLNQLKEEYIYARFLYYEGEQKSKTIHFADKNVKLSDGMEYLNYSIRVEQLKSSYKILFSIYDKTAFFINDLWKLGFKEKMASADRVFKSKNYPRDNVSLTAMKWVYMEFCEKFGNAEAAYEKELKDLRNALEHKYVKVHEYKWKKELKIEDDGFYHLDEESLKKYTFRLLQLTREMVMYLVYAVGIYNSQHCSNESEKAVQLFLLDYADERKR